MIQRQLLSQTEFQIGFARPTTNPVIYARFSAIGSGSILVVPGVGELDEGEVETFHLRMYMEEGSERVGFEILRMN